LGGVQIRGMIQKGSRFHRPPRFDELGQGLEASEAWNLET